MTANACRRIGSVTATAEVYQDRPRERMFAVYSYAPRCSIPIAHVSAANEQRTSPEDAVGLASSKSRPYALIGLCHGVRPLTPAGMHSR
jgi:hypothetical protein